MTRSFSIIALVSLLCLCLMITAAGAVVQQVTVQGTVATVSESKNTLSINNPQQYGCDFGTGEKAPVCTYKPMNVSVHTGTVPDAAALTVFKPGDPIVATSIGLPLRSCTAPAPTRHLSPSSWATRQQSRPPSSATTGSG